jgi:hypothetical protein
MTASILTTSASVLPVYCTHKSASVTIQDLSFDLVLTLTIMPLDDGANSYNMTMTIHSIRGGVDAIPDATLNRLMREVFEEYRCTSFVLKHFGTCFGIFTRYKLSDNDTLLMFRNQ